MRLRQFEIGVASTLAPGAPVGNVTPGTGEFTTLSAVTSFSSTGNYGSQLILGRTGQSGRADFIGGVSGVLEASIGFESAAANGIFTFANTRTQFIIGGQEALNVRSLNGGSVSIGAITPTAKLHITAGAAAAGRAPLKFSSGPLNTVAEPGAEEFLTNDRYYTGTDGIRRRYAVNGQVITLRGYTVATLPTAVQGDKAFVTDAAAPTYLAGVVGGGAIVTEVFYNGTSWVCT